jgi:HSP20 family protein
MSDKEIEKKGEITPSSEDRYPSRDQTLSRGFDSIFDDFRRSFDNLMAPFMPMRRSLTSPGTYPTRYPLCDLVDEGDTYLVRAELPGIKKDNVDIELNKDTLRLNAELQEEREESEGDYLHRERTYSRVSRTIRFPEEVDPDKVQGEMEDGILRLTINKKEPKPEEKMRKVELK